MKQFFILSLSILFAGTALMAQSARSDYFMQNSYSRTSMNPAFIPRQGYIGIPGISSLTIESGTNAIYWDNLLFDRNGEKVTFMHPSVSSQEFLGNIPDKSNLSANVYYQPVSFGFFTKSGGFWSFGLGLKGLADINIPKPLFELLKTGFSADGTVTYPVRNLRMSAGAYSEISAGYARTFLNNKLSVGAKAKLLFGMAGVDLNIETLDVSARKDQWTALSKASLKGSGFKATYGEDGLFESIEPDISGIGGVGLGLDLGAVYNVFDKAKVSLAVTDLGFISWSTGSSVHLKAPETQITVIPGENSTGEGNFNFKENLDTAVDNMMEALNFKESGTAQGNTAMLNATVNLGFEYEVLPGNLSAGLLSSTRFARIIHSELTLSANYNPAKIKWLSAALSYSFIHTNYTSFGLALHLAPVKGVRFFIASDYLIPKISGLLPVNGKTTNIQLGLSVPVGKVRN